LKHPGYLTGGFVKNAGVLLGATALLFAGLVGQARAGDVLFAVLRGLPGLRLYRLWSTGAELAYR
jgi:hypothetical protein